jgi:hypothetical protein
VSSNEEVRLRAGVYFLVPFTLQPGVEASWRLELCCSNGGALTVGRWLSVDAMAAAMGGGAATAGSDVALKGSCSPAVGFLPSHASSAGAEDGDEAVLVTGLLSADDPPSAAALASRLHSLPGFPNLSLLDVRLKGLTPLTPLSFRHSQKAWMRRRTCGGRWRLD